MITKILAPTVFPNEPRMTLWKDAAQLRKLAYSTNEELEEFLKRLSRKDKHQYFLANALGSDEAWGENSNGDAFEENELLPSNYKTFETHAKIFRHHANRPDSKAYGAPVKAFWNPNMHRVELLLEMPEHENEDILTKVERGDDVGFSMGCFVAGTLITARDGQSRKIEEIKVGDSVMTHMGRPRSVTELHRRSYDGEVVEIVLPVRPAVVATKEHPFWAVKKASCPAPKGEKIWWESASKISPAWINADQLEGYHLLGPAGEGGYLVTEIQGMHSYAKKCMVFNFEVDEDHSYIAGGVAVHNCRVKEDQCLPTGAPIEVGSVKTAPIESLKVGDLVRTHTGKLRPVTKLFSRSYSGDLFTLKGRGIPSITLTPNHPVYAVPQDTLRSCEGSTNGRRRLHTLGPDSRCRTCSAAVTPAPSWVTPPELRVGDYLVYPNFLPPRVHLGVHLSYLLGVLAATGRVNERDSIDVSLWADEPELLSQLTLAVSKVPGATVAPKIYHQGKLVTHRIHSRKLSTLFKTMFSLNGHYYAPTDAIMTSLGREDWLWFLAGAIDANGVFRDLEAAKLKVHTANPHFANLIQKVCWILGAPCSVQKMEPSRHRELGVSRETFEYHVHLNPSITHTLLKSISTRVAAISLREISIQHQIVTAGLTLIPITDICKEAVVDRRVYNVAVDVDESYVSVTVLHNCSWCANPAKTKAEYCDHIKMQLKHVREDGTVCKMLNKQPTFFDISVVNVPADKTAWLLSKVAHETANPSYVLDQKNQKFAHDVYQKTVFAGFPPVYAAQLIEKYASLPESVRMAEIAYAETPKTALRRKVADIDKVITSPMSAIGHDALYEKFRNEGLTPLRTKEAELSSHELDEAAARCGGDPSCLLSTLAAYGVVLKPREYQRLVLGVAGDEGKELRDHLDASGATFEHLDPTPTEIQFHPTLDQVDHDAAGELAPAILRKSWHRGALKERLKDEGPAAEPELQELPDGVDEHPLSVIGGGFQDYTAKATSFAREAAGLARFYFPDSNLRVRLELDHGDAGPTAVALGAPVKEAAARGDADDLALITEICK